MCFSLSSASFDSFLDSLERVTSLRYVPTNGAPAIFWHERVLKLV